MGKTNKDDFVIEDGILKRFKGDAEEVVIPEGVITIQEAAFIECPELKSVVFPNTLEHIESMAFLTESPISVFIPASVQEIDANAFFGAGVSKIEIDPHNPMYHCVNNCLIETKRKYLVLCGEGAVLPNDGSVEVIGNGSCNSLLHTSAEAEPYSLTIPEGIKSIEQGAFCFANIKDLTLPESLAEIGESAFIDCHKLIWAVIPAGVKKIGNNAFDDNWKLHAAFILGYETEFGKDVFIDCDNLTIYAHKGSTAEKYAKQYKIHFKKI